MLPALNVVFAGFVLLALSLLAFLRGWKTAGHSSIRLEADR
jgi:hypothetical protein